MGETPRGAAAKARAVPAPGTGCVGALLLLLLLLLLLVVVGDVFPLFGFLPFFPQQTSLARHAQHWLWKGQPQGAQIAPRQLSHSHSHPNDWRTEQGEGETRVLLTVAAYNHQHRNFLDEILDRANDWCEGGFRVDIVVDTAVYWPRAYRATLRERMLCYRMGAPVNVSFWQWPKGIKDELTRAHRMHMYRGLDVYDVFAYLEDDVIVPLSTLRAWMHETARLQSLLMATPRTVNEAFLRGSYMVGWLRFEDKMALSPGTNAADARVTWEFLAPKETEALVGQKKMRWGANVWDTQVQLGGREDAEYFVTKNVHQAGYFLTRENLATIVEKCRNFLMPDLNRHRMKEEASSFDLERCGIKRVLPVDRLVSLGAHHGPDKNFKRRPDRVYSYRVWRERFSSELGYRTGLDHSRDRIQAMRSATLHTGQQGRTVQASAAGTAAVGAQTANDVWPSLEDPRGQETLLPHTMAQGWTCSGNSASWRFAKAAVRSEEEARAAERRTMRRLQTLERDPDRGRDRVVTALSHSRQLQTQPTLSEHEQPLRGNEGMAAYPLYVSDGVQTGMFDAMDISGKFFLSPKSRLILCTPAAQGDQ